MSEKTIYITAMIMPFDKGKRKIVITGAPEDEMPLVASGLFPQLHELIDQVWLDLSARRPQTVHHKGESKPGVQADTGENEQAKLPVIEGEPPLAEAPAEAVLAEARQAMVEEVAEKMEADNA